MKRLTRSAYLQSFGRMEGPGKPCIDEPCLPMYDAADDAGEVGAAEKARNKGLRGSRNERIDRYQAESHQAA